MDKIKFSTPIIIKKSEMGGAYDSIISGIGSCFAQYIMEHLKKLGFNASYNPNGIVYNAVSISKSLDHIVNDREYDASNFIKHNNLWHSWEHHGSFSAPTQAQLKENINKAKTYFFKQLAKSVLFILTPSSSVVYCLNDSSAITANCHKYPGKYFTKKVLSTAHNAKAISACIESIKKINSSCKIIITLSPVRHYPGNLVLNAHSKANLLSAIHQCVGNFDNVAYFPSYEILLDELRDYRFFNEDMLHPTDFAKKIILQRFISTYFTAECQKIITEKEKLLKSQQHKIGGHLLVAETLSKKVED
jgi:hypothetical protein